MTRGSATTTGGPSRRRPRRLAAAVAIGALAAVLPAGAAIGARQALPEPVGYIAPVEGPVLDPFRPPAHFGGPGNRGLQYDNPLWVPVVASADGVVVFSGQVFGSGTVVIEHADGIATTYNGMGEIWVSAGTQVRQLDGLGLAGTTVHFGAKRRNEYVDPQILIDASDGGGRIRLVPVD